MPKKKTATDYIKDSFLPGFSDHMQTPQVWLCFVKKLWILKSADSKLTCWMNYKKIDIDLYKNWYLINFSSNQ